MTPPAEWHLTKTLIPMPLQAHGRLGALAAQVPLELGEHRQHTEDHPPRGRSGVDSLGEADEISPYGADGYAWHLKTLRSGDRVYREYEANGNGGQFLIVLPELDLAVVFTAGNYLQGGIWRRFRDQLVPQVIIPAIRDH